MNTDEKRNIEYKLEDQQRKVMKMMVKCMRCRMLFPESKMHKLMRYHEITPGANFNQIQTEFRYYVVHGIGKKFMGYMCDDCYENKGKGK